MDHESVRVIVDQIQLRIDDMKAEIIRTIANHKTTCDQEHHDRKRDTRDLYRLLRAQGDKSEKQGNDIIGLKWKVAGFSLGAVLIFEAILQIILKKIGI